MNIDSVREDTPARRGVGCKGCGINGEGNQCGAAFTVCFLPLIDDTPRAGCEGFITPMRWRWAPPLRYRRMSAHLPARPLMKSEGVYTGAVDRGAKTPATYVGGAPGGKSLVVVH